MPCKKDLEKVNWTWDEAKSTVQQLTRGNGRLQWMPHIPLGAKRTKGTSTCQNWPTKLVSRAMEWVILKAWFHQVFKLEHSENVTRYFEEIQRTKERAGMSVGKESANHAHLRDTDEDLVQDFTLEF